MFGQVKLKKKRGGRKIFVPSDGISRPNLGIVDYEFSKSGGVVGMGKKKRGKKGKGLGFLNDFLNPKPSPSLGEIALNGLRGAINNSSSEKKADMAQLALAAGKALLTGKAPDKDEALALKDNSLLKNSVIGSLIGLKGRGKRNNGVVKAQLLRKKGKGVIEDAIKEVSPYIPYIKPLLPLPAQLILSMNGYGKKKRGKGISRDPELNKIHEQRKALAKVYHDDEIATKLQENIDGLVEHNRTLLEANARRPNLSRQAEIAANQGRINAVARRRGENDERLRIDNLELLRTLRP